MLATLLGWALWLAVAVVVVAAALVFGALPLAFRSHLRHKMEFEFDEFDPRDAPPPEPVWAWIKRCGLALEALDFEPWAYLHQRGMMPGIENYLVLYTHGPTGDIAAIISTRTEPPEDADGGEPAPHEGWIEHASDDPGVLAGGAQQHYLEFTTAFEGGVTVDTNNCAHPATNLAQPPWHRINQLAHLRDPGDLLAAHRLIARWQAAGRAVEVRHGHGPAGEMVAHDVLRIFEHQVDAGWFVRDEEAREFVPTTKGLYLMVWRNLPGLVGIRRRQAARRARMALARARAASSSAA